MSNERVYRRPEKVIVYLYRCLPFGGAEYLLLQRAPTSNAGSIWQTVVGGAKWHEELVEAARREVYEETGLTQLHGLTAIGYAFSFSLRLPEKQASEYDPGVTDIRNTVFAAEVVSQEPIALSHEHINYGWFPYQVAVERIHWPEEKEALARLHPLLGAQSADVHDRRLCDRASQA
jgi:8-oxo-dGTP pyrophosphatase MutT (NUDIX family)